MTAIAALDLPARQGTDYPAPHDAPCRNRIRRALGDAFGLSQFGVNMLELPPGAWSSQRHWHEQQDEFVYVLEGEVVLVTDEGETVAAAGHDRRLSAPARATAIISSIAPDDRARARGRHAHDAKRSRTIPTST